MPRCCLVSVYTWIENAVVDPSRRLTKSITEEVVKALVEHADLLFEFSNSSFEVRDARLVGGIVRRGRRAHECVSGFGHGVCSSPRTGRDRFDGAAEEVSVAGLLGAGLAGQDGDERRRALGKLLKTSEDVGDFAKGVKTLSAAAQFSRGLRAAEEENADEGEFSAGEVVGLAEPVLILRDAAVGAASATGKTDVFKAAQGEVNFFFVEIHDGLAVRALVAGVDQGIEREGVVVGGGGFFFEEGAKDAGIRGGEKDDVIDSHASSTMRQWGAGVNGGGDTVMRKDGRPKGEGWRGLGRLRGCCRLLWGREGTGSRGRRSSWARCSGG